MSQRCPQSKFVGPAVLEDYKLIFDGYHDRWDGAVANIVPTKGEYVSGAVYEITDSELRQLDKIEEYGNMYSHKMVHVKTSDGDAYDAITYSRRPKTPGKPSTRYLAVIESGRKDCGIAVDGKVL